MGNKFRNFLAEIVRRRVASSLGAYIVAMVFVLGAAELILPSMQVPDYVYDILVAFLLLSLPVVLILSWYFDFTKNGIVRTLKIDSQDTQKDHSKRGAESLANPGNSFGGTGFSAQTTPALAGALGIEGSFRSVAILPFVNTSHDEESEYLSDGITETIINKLAQITDVRVIPRASSFRYKESKLDSHQISQELGVVTLVTGSVKHYGNELVVQAELVDVQRQAQIWGGRFREPWENLFELQETIATEISSSLKPELSGEERGRIENRETKHLAAYQDYMRGRYHWNKRTAEGMQAATTHFQSAIERDPRYAEAYTGLADTYNIMGYYNLSAPDQSYPLAKLADRKALEINPNLATAYASLGYATLFYDRDWDAARDHFVRAIELDRDYSTAHQWYAWYYLVQGKFDDALNCLIHAASLDPSSLIINDHLAYGYILVGRKDDALKQIQRTRTMEPSYPLALWRLGDWHSHEGDHASASAAYAEAVELTDGRIALGYLGMSYAQMGQQDEARKVLARQNAYEETRFISPLDRAFVHAGLGDNDEAFSLINRAMEVRVSDMVRFALLPWPDAIKTDERFTDVIKTLNLNN